MNQLKEFLAHALPLRSYASDKPLFIITDNDLFFESIRSQVSTACRLYYESIVSEEDTEEIEYDEVPVLRIQPNDFYTPRGYSSIGCIVQRDLKPTDACLKSVTATLITTYAHDIRKGFLELDVAYGQS